MTVPRARVVGQCACAVTLQRRDVAHRVIRYCIFSYYLY